MKLVAAVFAFAPDSVVLIVQSFRELAARHALAPKQAEPPFLAAQVVSPVAFLTLGVLTVKRFRPAPHLVK